MLEFPVDKIYVVVGDQVFQQFVGIPLLADVFWYSYEANIFKKVLGVLKKTLPCPSIMHIDILTVSYQSTIITFIIMPIWCTLMNSV
jgi:hypothetical protein